MNFGLIVGEAFSGLRRNLSMVVSIILVTFVSLTFVGAAILMQSQISTMRDYFQDRAQVDVYLCSDISSADTCLDGTADDEKIAELEDQLNSDTLSPLIQDYRFESQAEAYKLNVENFPETAESLREEWTNAVFHITLVAPDDPRNAEAVVESFSDTDGVEEVSNQMAYLQPLFTALTIATYVAVGIAALMLISAVLLIGTTIRLSAYARRREVGIMRLVGASNRAIQTPFVLEGVIAAFVGSVLASGAIVAMVHFGVTGYLAQRMGPIPWVGMPEALVVVIVIVALGVLLSAVSAGFAIRRWLRA
ncbi:permease-like cell division protein FtsX [Microbacterium sp. JB110]|uniref:permease-like cell division protein FtsX n=1 Tax=Microbacterium sp. JB110 TaxID=2024477 RepID=UPI00097E9662|nr:permease-like cell division protein FtsX [Microbacterium sp. JB110]RCS62713.1 ABC transporter permease [Microbacterium sp. JB110]SJM63260.1 Cell division protein FtsX [Frigoribacterium sp. JB110]